MSCADVHVASGELAAAVPVSRPEVLGQSVRLTCGPLTGIEGLVVERRPGDRFLLQLAPGVFIETPLLPGAYEVPL